MNKLNRLIAAGVLAATLYSTPSVQAAAIKQPTIIAPSKAPPVAQVKPAAPKPTLDSKVLSCPITSCPEVIMPTQVEYHIRNSATDEEKVFKGTSATRMRQDCTTESFYKGETPCLYDGDYMQIKIPQVSAKNRTKYTMRFVTDYAKNSPQERQLLNKVFLEAQANNGVARISYNDLAALPEKFDVTWGVIDYELDDKGQIKRDANGKPIKCASTLVTIVGEACKRIVPAAAPTPTPEPVKPEPAPIAEYVPPPVVPTKPEPENVEVPTRTMPQPPVEMPPVVLPPPTIAMEKYVINDDGRTSKVKDFSPRINNVKGTFPQTVTVAPGKIKIGENSNDRYNGTFTVTDQNGLKRDVSKTGEIQVNPGDRLAAIFTNDDTPIREYNFAGFVGPTNQTDLLKYPSLPSSCPTASCAPSFRFDDDGIKYGGNAGVTTRNFKATIAASRNPFSTRTISNFQSLNSRFLNNGRMENVSADVFASTPAWSKISLVGNAFGEYGNGQVTGKGGQNNFRQRELDLTGGVRIGRDNVSNNVNLTAGYAWMEKGVIFPAPAFGKPQVVSAGTPVVRLNAQLDLFKQYVRMVADGKAYMPTNTNDGGRLTNMLQGSANVMFTPFPKARFSPYVGAGYQYNQFQYKGPQFNMQQNMGGPAITFGIRIH